MKALKLKTQDVIPLGTFKAKAAEHLKRLAATGQPLMITQNGKSAAILMAPAEYDKMTEYQQYLEGVAAGLADVRAGRVTENEKLFDELEAELDQK